MGSFLLGGNKNVHCIERQNLISSTLGLPSPRAEFFTSGGELVFTILTILKPTREVTSTKSGPFSALRCRAMKNSTPGKSQNNAKPSLGEILKKATEEKDEG
jgi:hypothetical protein